MPKRIVSVKLLTKDHRKFRLRTRREIKTYMNAMIANGKTNRKGTKRTLAMARKNPKFWNKKTSYMAVYFMYKSVVAQSLGLGDDCARNERFALKA